VCGPSRSRALNREPPVADQLTILTIGHSNHSLDDFLALLQQHRIEAIVDIRRFPGSKRHPQFGRESLSVTLEEQGIEYYWLEALGGRRQQEQSSLPSPNDGLLNPSFRNYADYMASDDFRQGVARLLDIAQCRCTAIIVGAGQELGHFAGQDSASNVATWRLAESRVRAAKEPRCTGGGRDPRRRRGCSGCGRLPIGRFGFPRSGT
jgi:hypothetical protein